MTSDEIKKAMLEFKPVKYKGIIYSRITAYIYRVVKTQGKFRTILQCELLDQNEKSVTIAEAERVEPING